MLARGGCGRVSAYTALCFSPYLTENSLCIRDTHRRSCVPGSYSRTCVCVCVCAHAYVCTDAFGRMPHLFRLIYCLAFRGFGTHASAWALQFRAFGRHAKREQLQKVQQGWIQAIEIQIKHSDENDMICMAEHIVSDTVRGRSHGHKLVVMLARLVALTECMRITGEGQGAACDSAHHTNPRGPSS